MNIPEAYDYWSSTYDTVENLTRDLDRIITRDSLADFQCKTILEVGCGTGKNTALLAKIGEQVLALDISRRMIRKAV
jgi:malonyl-CoA O-methyltransferase